MPFKSNGTLTTDKLTVNDSETWDSQSEWEAYQSATGVAINNGAVELAEQVTQVYNFDDDGVGAGSPGPWTLVNSGGNVNDQRSYSAPNSYYVTGSASAGGRFIQTTFPAEQYSETFSYRYYEEGANNSRVAVEWFNGSGDTLLFAGTNSTQVLAEGATTDQISSGNNRRWNEIRVTFLWNNSPPNVAVEFGQAGFSSPEKSNTIQVKNQSTAYNLGGVAITFGGESGTWGGSGNSTWVDDVVLGV